MGRREQTMRYVLSSLFVVLSVLAAGCETNSPSTTVTSGGAPLPPPVPEEASADAAAAPAAAPNAPAAAPSAPTDAAPQQAPAAAPAEPAAQPAPAAADGGTVEKAGVGVGRKGKDYGGPGFITTPVATFFRAEERIYFEAQIPNAMKIYKAEHNNKGPKTHEEFMDVIIKEHGVPLPELPAGDSYVYDPKTEELLVKHPSPAQPAAQ